MSVPAPDITLPKIIDPMGEDTIVYAPDLADWVWAEIISPKGRLYNEDHKDLFEYGADVVFCLIGQPLLKSGVRTVGRAKLAKALGGDKWAVMEKKHYWQLLRGEVPDFQIMLDLHYVAECLEEGRPERMLAVIDHELYHCGIQKNQYGESIFNKATGEPQWGLQPHDVEEFEGVVRRWGVDALSDKAQSFVQTAHHAIHRGPEIARAELHGICGTCDRRIGG